MTGRPIPGKRGLIERASRVFTEAALGCIVIGLIVGGMAGAQNVGLGTDTGAHRGAATDAGPLQLGAETAPAESRVGSAPGVALTAAVPPGEVQPTKRSPVSAPTSVATSAAAEPVQPSAVAAVTPPVAVPADSAAPAAAPATASPPPGATTEAALPDAGPPPLKPAKLLFGSARGPAPLAARAIGSYARGCLSGAKALPVDGPAWQAMRLSRNRNWGHPRLIALVQRLAEDGRTKDGWPGLLVGDISQPRGGPMLTGHASHQIGLDADVWLTPMPDRRLSERERETMSAVSVLADDATSVAREKWSDAHVAILKRAASYPDVERVLVHPAIKQVLCYAAPDKDRAWLSKVRPYWGHHYHFHIRMACPRGSASCVPQAPTPDDDGCGKDLDDWLKRVGSAVDQPGPIPVPPAKPPVEKPGVTLDQLPAECRIVLATGNPEVTADVAAASLAAAKASGKVKDDVRPTDARPGEGKPGEGAGGNGKIGTGAEGKSANGNGLKARGGANGKGADKGAAKGSDAKAGTGRSADAKAARAPVNAAVSVKPAAQGAREASSQR